MTADNLSERVKQAAREGVEAFSQENLERLVANYFRCRTLVDIHGHLAKTLSAEAPGVQDVLRAAVVLLHASVEDMLRTAAVALIPAGPSAGLDSIYWPADRPKEKAAVSILAAYRGRSVDEVLSQCVEEHFARQTFNNSTDVMNLLTQFGLTAEERAKFRPFLGNLDAMMKRRHQIVHRADRDVNAQVVALAVGDVVQWMDTVQDFGRAFFMYCCAKPAVLRAGIEALYAENPGGQ